MARRLTSGRWCSRNEDRSGSSTGLDSAPHWPAYSPATFNPNTSATFSADLTRTTLDESDPHQLVQQHSGHHLNTSRRQGRHPHLPPSVRGTPRGTDDP